MWACEPCWMLCFRTSQAGLRRGGQASTHRRRTKVRLGSPSLYTSPRLHFSSSLLLDGHSRRRAQLKDAQHQPCPRGQHKARGRNKQTLRLIKYRYFWRGTCPKNAYDSVVHCGVFVDRYGVAFVDGEIEQISAVVLTYSRRYMGQSPCSLVAKDLAAGYL